MYFRSFVARYRSIETFNTNLRAFLLFTKIVKIGKKRRRKEKLGFSEISASSVANEVKIG